MVSSPILLWERRLSPPHPPHPISERRPFQGPSILQRRPELCSSIPSSVPASLDSLSLGLSLLFQKGRKLLTNW